MYEDKHTREEFFASASGIELQRSGSLDRHGVFMILNFRGIIMTHAEGNLTDVVNYAIDIPDFWYFGTPGCIRQAKVFQITPNFRKLLSEELVQIKAREDEIRKTLSGK